MANDGFYIVVNTRPGDVKQVKLNIASNIDYQIDQYVLYIYIILVFVTLENMMINHRILRGQVSAKATVRYTSMTLSRNL